MHDARDDSTGFSAAVEPLLFEHRVTEEGDDRPVNKCNEGQERSQVQPPPGGLEPSFDMAAVVMRLASHRSRGQSLAFLPGPGQSLAPSVQGDQ